MVCFFSYANTKQEKQVSHLVGYFFKKTKKTNFFEKNLVLTFDKFYFLISYSYKRTLGRFVFFLFYLLAYVCALDYLLDVVCRLTRRW